MKRNTILAAVVCNLCIGLIGTAPAFAENVSQFVMKTSDLESTGEFTVTMKGENIQDLYAYEVKFSLDPSKLEVVSADTNIDGFSISPMMKGNELTIAHTKVGKVVGEKGNLDIGTITFRAKKAGVTNIEWTHLKIVDHNLKSQSFTRNDAVDFTKIFSDLAGHWAKTDVMQMVGQGIVEGMDDNHFAPDTSVTRAQFATLLAKALQLKDAEAGKMPFNDVATGSWYEGTVKKAFSAGLINGVSATAFAPETIITREEMTAMLIRAKAYASGTKVEEMKVDESIHFGDDDAVSHWSVPFVKLAVGAKLMEGRTTTDFAPLASASRAEAVVVLKRLLAGIE
ncbi:S-layer homology domain-containing protein [Paenibacillus qinlingensis]|uniref:S-layer homology domain-containing protein n=1 Tax=Paenibacillus qinlingensis TaxID=1837343 RepID=UPI0015664BD6|nr:S-layer homology domain-containing protein [Paenibacillus qinlingensis]NQX63356.1 S-layer homology domain-containing protein [Paenibacillus qinlingensis]